MEPSGFEGVPFTETPCEVVLAADRKTGVAYVMFTLPGGCGGRFLVLPADSARQLGLGMLEAANAADAMNSAAKGAIN